MNKIMSIVIGFIMSVTICSTLTFAGETPTVEELLERIEVLEEKVAALESGSSAELSSEQIVEDLTAVTWEVVSSEGSGTMVFDPDNKGSMTSTNSDGETVETPMKWVLKGSNIGLQTEDMKEIVWLEYNNQSGNPILIYDAETDNSMIFTPIEK